VALLGGKRSAPSIAKSPRKSGKPAHNAYVESFGEDAQERSLPIGYRTLAVSACGALGGFEAVLPVTPTKVVTLSAGSV